VEPTLGSSVGERVASDRPSPDTEAMADLFREQYTAAVRLGYLLTGNRAVAEDLVQDSFVRLFGHWSRVERPAAYLRTSVVNACRAHHRRAGRERAHFPDLVVDTVSPETR
jgi:DNA-directed RNA polymerase specialized sigma24 family protein